MRRVLVVLVVGAFLAVSPSLGTAWPGGAQAASETGTEAAETLAAHEAGEHGQPPIVGWKVAVQFLNFGVLAFLLVFFGGRAINKSLLARHDQLKADLASAAEARAAAEERLKRHEARLTSLEHEIAVMRAGIKEEAELEKARLIAAAEERAKRIREETAFLLDQQVKEAELQLKREAAEASVKVAEDLLRRALDGQDQQRMVDTFVREVATGDGTPAQPPVPGEGTPPPRPAPRSEA